MGGGLEIIHLDSPYAIHLVGNSNKNILGPGLDRVVDQLWLGDEDWYASPVTKCAKGGAECCGVFIDFCHGNMLCVDGDDHEHDVAWTPQYGIVGPWKVHHFEMQPLSARFGLTIASTTRGKLIERDRVEREELQMTLSVYTWCMKHI
ncbi:hypothetical protein ACJX0J_006506 [Zea mays]